MPTDDPQTWTLGRWQTKPGNETAFRDAWHAFATWTAANQPGAGAAHLLQDAADPTLFYSFGPWQDADAVAAWRSTPQFQAFLTQARALCDQVEPHLLNLVAEI